MPALELRIPPPLVTLVFAGAMAALAYALPSSTLAIPGRLAVAVALALAGAGVALAGVLAFRQHRTTVNPLAPERASSLVASGIYRFSRNPMYLGMLLALLGWWVFLANWAGAPLLPLFVLYMNRFQIRPEERVLAQKFGPPFQAYCRSVRRWL